jgi:hypothetical protein
VRGPQQGDLFYRCEHSAVSRRVLPPRTIRAGTYGFPASELNFVPTGFAAVGRYALPDLPRGCRRYKINPPLGVHPDRVIYCETWKDRDVLPAMEEGLRCAGLAGVVGKVTRLSLTASHRLQLCAAQSGVTALALRRWRNTTEKELADETNATATRWRVSPSPSDSDGFDSLQRQHWLVELLRLRGVARALKGTKLCASIAPASTSPLWKR